MSRRPNARRRRETGRFPMRRAEVLEVLAGISGTLTRGGHIDIDATLRLIGGSVGVDRMYLFENGVHPTTNKTLCSQRFEWAHGSVSAEIDNPQLQNLPYGAISDVLEDVLRRGEVFAGITRELEPKFRALLEPQGIQSICLVPVIFDEQLWGFVGFDDCHSERAWNDEEVAVLRLIAAIVGGYYSRERMRAALAATEAQYRYLVDNVHEVIFECDAEGRLTFLNRAWTKHLGYRIDESVGRRLFDYIVPDAREWAAAELARTKAEQIEECWHEARFLSRDGEERWMQMLCRFTHNADGTVGVLGTMADITERRWAQETLRRRQLDESLSTLAGGIAHDFNNVLHGMLTAAKLLERRHGSDEDSAELLSIVRTSGERMADLTSKLLAYSRGGSYETARLDPAQLVEDALKIGRARVSPDVRVEVSSSLSGAHVEGDRGQLFQVVLNLVVNAVEAMAEGGVLRIDIAPAEIAPTDLLVRERTLTAAGPYVRLAFADQGPGIEPDVLPRIFEPFFSTKSQGRGLGLAAARGIIASHGGAITVESVVERGATFHVLLPRCEGEAVELARGAEQRDVAGGLVLVVDDEEPILRVTAEMLEGAGYRVLLARRGEEALSLYERHAGRIDAVLVDYLMPDMDGGQLIRALRKRAPDLRVVLCTGYDRAQSPVSGLEDVPRLEKPFPAAELLALLAGAPSRSR